jgi:TolA-binding protein
VLAALAWARGHLFIAVAAALVVIAAVTLAVRIAGSAAGTGHVDVKAEKALADARLEFSKGGVAAGTAALEKVREDHSGSRAGREATFLLANTYFETGDYTRALSTYEEFLKRPLHDDLLVDGATTGIAACQEEMGNQEAAAATYLGVWNSGHTPAARLQAALGAARCYEAVGKIDQALQTYQEVIDKFPEAPESDDARFEKLRLESMKTSGGTPAPAPTTP